jgi:hypothetical protein
MKKLFAILFLLVFVYNGFSQKLSGVNFQNGAKLSFFSFTTEQGAVIRVSEDGKILEWGTEVLSERGNYYAPKLQPFNVRTETFDSQSDSAYRNKIKSIGTTYITYYSALDEEMKRGKLKTIGSLQFDYYSKYDEKSLQGKLKMAGTLLLEYYRQYENEAFRGKLKSIGSVPITYYSAFDDRYNAGKLKTIGVANYTWYSEIDQARGALKSNNYRQTISGITYILR